MIELKHKCANVGCEDGKVNTNRYYRDQEPNWQVCSTCNGVGHTTTCIGALVTREQNYGDHGEVHTFALDVGPDVTIGELVGKLWGDNDFYRQGPLNVVFTKAEVYPFTEERF